MIKHITHAGVMHVDRIADNLGSDTPCLLISILDHFTPHQRPKHSKFHDSLSLSFKDRCEEDYGILDHWPDEPSDDLVFSILRIPHERLFSLSDAKLILEFFEKYHAEDTEYNLIAHCKSGVGRSAAIAEFFGIIHNIEFVGTDPRKRFLPNCRVTRLLTKAYHDKYKHADNGNRITEIQQLDFSNRCYITS